ncbi:MAG: extracellular solute-binding protein [Chloroflexi bacterium]|nr:extracellular solute-binding protein [Chloroflexota bacterium]MCC6895741.1 extracellular solute-binding protein [Anaerolineae bacterium]
MRIVHSVLILCLSALSVACSPTLGQPVAVTAEATIGLTDTPPLPTPSATAEPDATEEILGDNTMPTLRVWWPDSLEPAGNQTAALMLADYMETFRTTVPDLTLDLRLKKAQDIGGIIQTLRSAITVAPDALPDITLLRRSDFLAAVEAGYLQPIQGSVTSAILGDLYPAALDLGRVDGVLYGLSYALDVEHIAYRPVVLNGNFASFEDVLQDQQKFVFPAGVTQGLSDVLLLQYLSAGGTMNELVQGRPNAEALETVLDFYEQAVQEGVIDRSVLDYARSDDYLFQLAQGKFDAGVITSSQYLSLLTNGQTLQAAPIPLADGQPSTVVNGWMWVVVTKDRDQQLLALRFAEWMMDSERLAVYTRMVNMLPSRRAAMRSWDGGDFTELANTLLANAYLPVAEGDSGTLRSMENALAAVISGQRTSADAVQDVLEQLN